MPPKNLKVSNRNIRRAEYLRQRKIGIMRVRVS